MPTTNVTVSLKSGLHARPASKFVNLANNFSSEVHLLKGDKKVNAKSIMGVLSLAVTKGSKIGLQAEGDDAVEALENLAKYLQEQK